MRYAIYFTPPASSPLWQQGSRWLGRDAHNGQTLPQPRFRGLDPERVATLTRTPARYGFHATIVPPFRLAEKRSEENLFDALTDFVSRQRPVPLAELEISLLDHFFCLRPMRHSQAVQALAAQCIRSFDRCRAPLTPSEMARSKAAILSGQEKKNLEMWGYPYVFEQFRFHFTLTARMAEDREKEVIHSALVECFSPLLKDPLVIDALCLFIEPEPGQPMRCLYRFPFASTSSGSEASFTHDQQRPAKNLYSGYQCHPA
jgi:putative phosphonate metabolism protein